MSTLNITDAAFQSFFAGCTKIYTDYCDKSGYAMRDTFDATDGVRYIRVIRQGVGSRSVHCFVDKTNGDVLKAASWKTPAKHARGNVFDAANGLGSMGEYGPAYLR